MFLQFFCKNLNQRYWIIYIYLYKPVTLNHKSWRICVSNNAAIFVDLSPLRLWNPWNNQMRLSTEKLLWFWLVSYSKTAWTLTRIMGEDPALLRRIFFWSIVSRKKTFQRHILSWLCDCRLHCEKFWRNLFVSRKSLVNCY